MVAISAIFGVCQGIKFFNWSVLCDFVVQLLVVEEPKTETETIFYMYRYTCTCR